MKTLCQLVASFDQVLEGPAGTFCYTPAHDAIIIKLPCPRDEQCPTRIPITGPKAWQFTGPDEKPSLTPSILAVGEWHGYLTHGELIEC